VPAANVNQKPERRKDMVRIHIAVGNLIVAVMSLALAPLPVAAQEEKPSEQKSAPAMPMMGPEMMRQMQAMMMTPIFLDSPCALYGQAQSLGLNDEQKKRLGEIEKEGREKALAVLSDEQRIKLGTVPSNPVSMIQMGAQMMPQMQQMMGDKDMQQMMNMCPMWKMMKQSSAP
jgi:hypothetical protein